MASLSLFAACSSYAFMVVGAILLAFGLRRGSYLFRVSQHERVFRQALLPRIGSAVFSIAFLQAPLIFADRDWGAVLLLLLICLPFAALMLSLSVADELRLNMAERTYQRVSGWPFGFKNRSGPWTDLWGVYIGSGGRSTYFVGIRGMRLGPRMDLGRFGMYAAAEQFAQELMSELSLPQVPTPPPLVQPTVRRRKVGR